MIPAIMQPGHGAMIEGLHGLAGLPHSDSHGVRELAGLSQQAINALPSIMGPVTDPDSDSTARVDRGGYVYLWEPGEGIGFWVQAGFVRNLRQKFGQMIDPNDIQWFDLAVFRKKLARAKKSLNAVRMPDGDDTWNTTRDGEHREARAYRFADDDDGIDGSVHPPDDADIV